MSTCSMKCEGCLEEFINIWDNHPVCMNCVQARAKATFTHRCSCRKKRPIIVQTRYRTWVSCQKCLATITGKSAHKALWKSTTPVSNERSQ